MMSTVRAEWRKLLTVRSTYFTSILSWLLMGFFAFWVEGYKGFTPSGASAVNDKALQDLLLNAVPFVAGFTAIIAILFMVHEYRYNTIMYTLTASNSRSKVLFSKLLVIVTFAAVFAVLTAGIAIGCYLLGISLRDGSLPAQNWNVLTTLGKTIFCNVGYTLLGLMFGALARNIAAATAMLFLIPNTVEPLLSLLLKEKAVYLPFAALDRVVANPTTEASIIQGNISPGRAMAVAGVYIAVGGLITWLLFLRRDAN